METFKINYKSDFVLRLASDAGWGTAFTLEFWANGAPTKRYYATHDGNGNYTNCKPDSDTELRVMFDDHGLGIGNLMLRITYSLADEEFRTGKDDEVVNVAAITVLNDEGEEVNVILNLEGETAAEVQYSLPLLEAEKQRQQAETLRNQAELGRQASEDTRKNNERARETAELQRQTAEAARVTEFETNEAERQATFKENEARREADTLQAFGVLVPISLQVEYPKALSLGNAVSNYIVPKLAPESALPNVIYISDNKSLTVEPNGKITPVKVGVSRIHVIPTLNTSLARTISIDIYTGLRKVLSASLRLTSNGNLRLI